MDPIYIAEFVDAPDTVLAALQTNLEWERRDAPRSEYYFNDYAEPYTYGRGAGRRTYTPHTRWHPLVYDIREKLERQCNCIFEACFLNRYHDQRDHLGWHSDDSPEMDPGRSVVSVSLGVEREIWIRPRVDRSESTQLSNLLINKYSLAHGSAFIMPPGFQQLYQHKIPKASFICGERISLTFRGYRRAAKPEDL
jgi:alkylated DNA repair dioxygenase AlkB